MKKWMFITAVLAFPISMMAQDDDGMYFVPKKKADTSASASNTRPVTQVTGQTGQRPALEVYNTNSRDEDEYNRRYDGYTGAYQTGGGYAEDSLAATVEYVDKDSERYPDEDYYYSRRILRFRSPRAIALSSPYYWDLVYDYGVYDYLYDPFYYDPFFWHYGWGYGWSWGPWSAWYGPIWGWHHPYAWTYWGWGPGWHHHHGGFGAPGGWTGRGFNRGTFANNRYGSGTRIRTSGLANGGSASTGRGTFGTQTGTLGGRGTQTAIRGGRNTSGRTAGTAAAQTGVRTNAGSYSEYTRSRSTSTYSQSRTEGNRNTTNVRPSSSRTTSQAANNTYTPSRSTQTISSGNRNTISSGGGSSRGGGFSGGSRGGGFSGGGGSRGGRR